MAPLISKDHRDYQEPDREHWTKRAGPPITLSSAAGGVGLLIGLVIGWTTELREATPAVVGALGGMLGFDFYWRHVRETLPRQRRNARNR